MFSLFAAWFPGGATLFQPCIRWPRPLTEPDLQIFRIRLFRQAHRYFSDSRFSSVDNAFPGSVPCIVSLPRYTCLSIPSLHPALAGLPWYYGLIRLPVAHPQTSLPRFQVPLYRGRYRSSQVPEKSLQQHAVDYDPGGVSAISPLTMTALLPSVFLITWACSTP